MQFPNIIFDKSILETDDKNWHLHNLKIASLNLQEFNKRNPENIAIKFSYKQIGNDFLFERVKDILYQHYSDEYLPLNRIITISSTPGLHKEWIKRYPNEMYEVFQKRSLVYGNPEAILFITLFENYIPAGDFLSEINKNTIKHNFNRNCELAGTYL